MAFLRGSSIYCIQSDEVDRRQRVAFSSVCITTATISSFGAIVQLINWSRTMRVSTGSRRIPAPTPHVVFSLALADFFTCVGAIAMSILFLLFVPAEKDRNDHVKPFGNSSYIWIGMPIESFTMFSYICSYMWTLFYSVDICLQVHNCHSCMNSKAYHVMSWPLAAWLVGCAQYVVYASNPEYCSFGSIALLHYLVCYVPLLLVMVSLPFVYWTAYKKAPISRHPKGKILLASILVQSMNSTLVFVTMTLQCIWLPNFIDGFHDIADYVIYKEGLTEDSNHFFLWMIEASVNPLQGFLNCLVYGQHRQFVSCCSHILSVCRSDLTHTPKTVNHDQYMERSRSLPTINSSTSIGIAVNEITPLLSGSITSAPASVATPPSNSPRQPFAVRLLGEFSR